RYLVVSRDPARRPPPSLPTRRSSHLEAQPVRLAEAVVGILSEDDHLLRVEGRGVEGREDLRTGRINPRTGHLALAQEGRQRAHVLAREPVADARLPGRFQSNAVLAHDCCAGETGRRDRRSWNSALVASSRSSIGLSTRLLAPSRSSAAWLARLSSPVITSTGSRRLP